MSHRLRARRLLPALLTTAAAAGLAAGPGTASAASIDASIPMVCATSTGASNEVIVSVKATAYDSVIPFGAARLSNFTASMRVLDQPGAENPNFIWGAISELGVTASGSVFGAGGGTEDLVDYSPFRFTPRGVGGYGPIAISTPSTVEAFAGADSLPVTYRISSLAYGYLGANNERDPVLAVVPAGITCKPKDGQGTFATVAPTTQSFSGTVSLTCSYDTSGGPARINDVELAVKLRAPRSVTPGGPIVLEGVSGAMRVLNREGSGASPVGTSLGGYLQGLSFALSSAAPAVVEMSGSGGAFPKSLTPAPYDGQGAWASQPLPLDPTAFVKTSFAQGGGPVAVSIGALRIAPQILQDGAIPPPVYPATWTCTPKPGQLPLGVIAGSDPVPATPAVSRVFGNAWAGVGGLLRVHGSNLKGAKYVTIGAKKVRPLLVIGSTDVWVLAPALAKGQYAVAVGTATSVSPPATRAIITYR